MAETCLITIASEGPCNVLGEIVINDMRVGFGGMIFMARQEIVIRDDGGAVKVLIRDRAPA